MGIYRVKKNANYVVMNRTALSDDRLSWKAKGIIAYMLSMPDDWKFYTSELARHAKDGEDSLRTGMKELKQNGYVRRFPIKDEKTKKIIEWETHVYEFPQVEKPHLETPHMEKPQVGNPTLPSTDSLSTDSLPTIDGPSTEIPYVEIVNYLNDVSGKTYKSSTKKTQSLIRARIEEGFTIDDFKSVINKKYAQWKDDPNMKKYIRPETLFGTKFEGYLNEEGGTHEKHSRDFEQQYGEYNFDQEREIDF